jgi:hypothetical protein
MGMLVRLELIRIAFPTYESYPYFQVSTRRSTLHAGSLSSSLERLSLSIGISKYFIGKQPILQLKACATDSAC